MIERVPMRERIAVQLQAKLKRYLPDWMEQEVAAGRVRQQQADAADVIRWEEDMTAAPLYSILLLEGDDELSEESQSEGFGPSGSGGVQSQVLQIDFVVFGGRAQNNSEPMMRTLNRWLARMESVVLNDPRLREDESDELLSVDIEKVAARAQLLDDREFSATLEVNVHYDVLRGNPYMGPGNTESEVNDGAE